MPSTYELNSLTAIHDVFQIVADHRSAYKKVTEYINAIKVALDGQSHQSQTCSPKCACRIYLP